jgi:hypothetical protein
MERNENSVSSINRRPGLLGEIHLQSRKVIAFKLSSFFCNGLIMGWAAAACRPFGIAVGWGGGGLACRDYARHFDSAAMGGRQEWLGPFFF